MWSKDEIDELFRQWPKISGEVGKLYGNKKLSLQVRSDQMMIKHINNCLVEEISEYDWAESQGEKLDELADVLNFTHWLITATDTDLNHLIQLISFHSVFRYGFTSINSDSIIGKMVTTGMMAMNLLKNRGWSNYDMLTDEEMFMSRIELYISYIIYFVINQDFTLEEVISALNNKLNTNINRIKSNY